MQDIQNINTLTALIIVLNGERTLDACLKSLHFCDEIIVIDSYSTDKTKEIALENKAVFIENTFKGYREQIQFGIDWIKRNRPTKWIFFLDCDELCSFELEENIKKKLLIQENTCMTYNINRRTWYYDRFLKYGTAYPDKLFRLFRPEAISIEEKNGHPIYVPKYEHKEIKGDLLHYSYYSFSHQVAKQNIYADRAAISMKNRKKKGGIMRAILYSYWRFNYIYFIRLGFLDGKAGFLYAMHTAFYTFSKYIRIDEGKWGEPFSRESK